MEYKLTLARTGHGSGCVEWTALSPIFRLELAELRLGEVRFPVMSRGFDIA